MHKGMPGEYEQPFVILKITVEDVKDLLKYRIRLLLALAISAMLTVTCGEKTEKDDVEPELTVKTNPVPAAGGDQFISISASGKWRLNVSCASGDNWAEVSPSTGNGNVDVVLSVEENTGDNDRTATITLLAGNIRKEITLTQKSSGGNSPGDSKPDMIGKAGWLELPAIPDDSGFGYFKTDMTIGSKTVRNYSFSWDYDNLVAPWVAYPLNKSLIGSGSRTDAWEYFDTKLIPADKQPELYRGFKPGTMSTSIDRGHQLPSADRLTRNANVQTFYFTNMTPQIGNFNQNIWAKLEEKVRSWANKSDTLYVVTGCVTKGSKDYALDNVGKHVTVPTAYYKVLLRYSSAGTIGTEGFMGCAMYMEHKSYSNPAVNSSYSMSIDELEEKLGIDFFANLPAKIGKDNADKVEAENPKNQNWWWN